MKMAEIMVLFFCCFTIMLLLIAWLVGTMLVEFQKVHKKLDRILFNQEHMQKNNPKTEKEPVDDTGEEGEKNE